MVLDVRGIQVVRENRRVIHDLSFSASRGECLALMGPSGSGKTTVLRAIAGLDPFTTGAVIVVDVQLTGGRIPHHVARRLHRRVGMVFQFHHLFAHMTALQNVWLAPVHVYGEPRGEAEARARRLLEKVGVGHRGEAFPHQLSGGEAQRVAIARALAVNPPLLLMDEPTASLDPARRGDLAATLHELTRDGTTVVISTHDADFARQCAARVLLLEDGRIRPTT